ncbi:MAG: repeat protein, partial [Sediminibacterium sp.]|nr:repeat protein [Sediminibacterium sp.]
MKRILFFILLLLGSACVYAGTGTKINFPLNGNGFLINKNLNKVIHESSMGNNINWAAHTNTSKEFYSFANTLELYQYESTDLPVNFEYDLTIKGKLMYYQLGSSMPVSQIVTLHINNKQKGASRLTDFYSYTNAYKSQFIIDEINLTGIPPKGTDLYAAVSKLVELNLSIQSTHYLQPVLGHPIMVLEPPCLDETSNEMVITWPVFSYAEEYELELLYVDDYKENGTPLSQADINFDFRENATRIVLKEMFYRLPMVYDRGYILYRVRPIGRGGPLWDKRIPGPWSTALVYGTVDHFNEKIYVAANAVHTLKKINWQVTTTYAEDGKRKDVVQYSDGLYMTRQTVTGVSQARNIFTVNGTNGGLENIQPCSLLGTEKLKEIIAQENIYDFNGRVGVQIMPVPTGTHQIDYIPHLNQNSSGIPYSWNDFDRFDNCGLPAKPLKQTGTGSLGAGQYYSPGNPNKLGYNAFIPDANGFAFSRVQYTDDNTGRVSRQGGVGPKFQLDSTHETKFFYGTPNQVELDRMFGTEVGFAKRYLKKMVVDPNGQTSVTYENPEGKTIATALAGDRKS